MTRQVPYRDLRPQPYYDKGMHFYDIPMGITETYGLGDINSTWELYLAQCTQYLRPANRGLIKIRDWMFRFCKALTQLERAGIFAKHTTV